MLACVLIPQFLLALALKEQGRKRPGLSVLLDAEGDLVLEVSSAAAERGVTPAMPIQEARALCPRATFFLHKPALADQALAELLEVLDTVSPQMEFCAPGEYLLNICSWKNKEAAEAEAKQIVERVKTALDLDAWVGIASQRMVARIAAASGKLQIVAPGKEAVFLAPRPVGLLPVDNECLRRLDLLGIHTLGELAELPVNDLVNQFGEEGQRLAEWVRGEGSSTLQAEERPEPISESCEPELPIGDAPQLLGEIQQLLTPLFERLRAERKFCTEIKLILGLANGQRAVANIALAAPHDHSERILPLLRHRLEAVSLPGPVVKIHITLEGLVAAYARQMELLPLSSAERRKQGIYRVAQRLEARQAGTSLMQVVWDDPESRIPEYRAHLQDLVRSTVQRPLCLPRPAKVVVNDRGLPAVVQVQSGWQQVDWIMESWQLDEDWWTALPMMRSYFRVMLKNGILMRLFKDRRNGSWFRQQV